MTKPVRAPAAASTTAAAGVLGPDVDGHAGSTAFREGMSRVASGVHVVTTDGAAGPAGLTATAVAGVSDHPPILLVCVNRAGHSAPRFLANGVFCVNTLAEADKSLADVFAGRTGLQLGDRFGVGQWTSLKTGAPVLEGALVSFDCHLLEVKDVATHHVFLGKVIAVRVGGEATPLLYWRRAYHAL
jgi:flavin reductase (DIM6/NTAB) family NADH-FMN oxidoreductase RutF